MNPFLKFVLKLLSSPRIDVEEDYESIRRFHQLFSLKSKKGYKILDYQLFSADHSHEIPIRVFYPEKLEKQEAILFYHGGGWVVGDIETYTHTCINMANKLGRVVYSVDYRLAPEYPYPAGLEDCYRVAELLFEKKGIPRQFKPEKFILMGDSAGGNLAAAVSLMLRDKGMKLPDKQVLWYPVTHWDHTKNSPFKSVEENGYDYGLTAKRVESYMELYAPEEELRRTPYISPLMAPNLRNQPETFIITAEFDPLRDEGEAYAKALQESGNKAQFHRVEESPHGFITYPENHPFLEEVYPLIKDFLDA
ncbi:alpha/beta hydrolase [Lacticigenium naphthae]|uniref:alpha/beta hydrolase n=1 Tax=Lacticigenium naphthae TaxID=515351 RepID=UPI0003F4B96D|nr:alpha/beta hydrolase [Lacticigenium naphthae]